VFKGFSNLTKQVVSLKEIRLEEEEGIFHSPPFKKQV
jgi:hypothetical protein